MNRIVQVVAVVAVVAVAAGGTILRSGAPVARPDVDMTLTGSIGPRGVSDSGRYLITNALKNTACFAGSSSVRDGKSAVAPDRSCEQVWPGLGRAVSLTERSDGTYALETTGGQTVLTLVAGDGVAYEAVEPKTALVTITRAD